MNPICVRLLIGILRQLVKQEHGKHGKELSAQVEDLALHLNMEEETSDEPAPEDPSGE